MLCDPEKYDEIEQGSLHCDTIAEVTTLSTEMSVKEIKTESAACQAVSGVNVERLIIAGDGTDVGDPPVRSSKSSAALTLVVVKIGL